MKMGQGRGSAMVTIALVCMVMVLLNVEMAQAAVYTVGDTNGWDFDAEGWPHGKSFKAGDVIVFNYNPSAHNVVVVDKAGYDLCVAPGGAKVYQSGKDSIRLVKGQNFFICSFEAHCDFGMKIAIYAA